MSDESNRHLVSRIALCRSDGYKNRFSSVIQPTTTRPTGPQRRAILKHPQVEPLHIMRLTTAAVAYLGGLLAVTRASPVARDNDAGTRPIPWQDPSGKYLCWAVEGGLNAGSQVGV
jgi:hypothetical protein